MNFKNKDSLFSIYTSLYKVNENSFDYHRALINFCSFADEVWVALSREEEDTDNSYDSLANWKKKYNAENLHFVRSTWSFASNKFDGQFKNDALQKTTFPLKIQMDSDEIIPLSQRHRWVLYVQQFLSQSRYQALFIPSLDLWGNEKYIRKNVKIGFKWRMHKAGLYRGVVNFAKLDNELFDPEKSDSCDLIDRNGDLVPTAVISPTNGLNPIELNQYPFLLQDHPYTLHYGYVNFDRRVGVVNKFWKPHWYNRGHKEVKITSKEELQKEEVIEHNLLLE